MHQIQLRYGRGALSLEYDEDRFAVLADADRRGPLSDVEIGALLESPLGSRPIEELVDAGESVLFVVPDGTRRTGCGQIINLLVRRLIASGSMPHEMSVIFATGIHRPVTAAEKREILTPFIAQRLKTLDHNARDLMQIVRMGETANGIPIELNRALSQFDHVILLGGVTFHYFAGFTGGRKLICPGLASARTISGTHKMAFDCGSKTRRDGVATGRLDGNPVHEAFVEAASAIEPSFSVNTIVDDAGEVIDLFCGEWMASHRAACDSFAARNTISIGEKRDLVVASCGGFPHDINMIQAHKALDAAADACVDGGTIVLLAECPEGMGRHDFLEWFSSKNSRDLAERLCERYQVNGQTAWSLLEKTERFRVRILTDVGKVDAEKLRMEKVDLEAVQMQLETSRSGYILPYGARTLITGV